MQSNPNLFRMSLNPSSFFKNTSCQAVIRKIKIELKIFAFLSIQADHILKIFGYKVNYLNHVHCNIINFSSDAALKEDDSVKSS